MCGVKKRRFIVLFKSKFNPLVYKKCLYANKAYFSDITVSNISQSLTHKMAAKASWCRNYVTVTLCIYSLAECGMNGVDAGTSA